MPSPTGTTSIRAAKWKPGSTKTEFASSRSAGLREHFLRHPSLSNADYRRIFAVSRYAAARELRRLVEGGFLRMEGKGRGARYLPEPSLDMPGNRAK